MYACDNCGVLQVSDDDCPVCGSSDHEEVEVGGDDHVCDECGDSFDTNRALSAHERVHDDE